MENVLGGLPGPTTPAVRMVCVDEGGKQLIEDVREPPPVRPGASARRDSGYRRGGAANLFSAFEPLAGWRRVQATGRKTSVDFARFLRALSDEHYPGAERVALVGDNLSTHTPASCTRRSSRPRRGGRRSGPSGNTPPSTAAG
ncbi:MAG: transposase [Gemmataceae bacterium]|nr:transposase [Gemmataceae bacterium]